MKTLKLINILKGERAENDYGIVKIQYKSEAKQISAKGYAIINCSSAYERKARVDWVENGSFKSTGVIGRTKALWFIKVKWGGFDKILKKNFFNVEDILQNLSTNGYTGVYICSQLLKGNKPNSEKVANMKIAQLRHSETDYDSISKKGLSDYAVRELRRNVNSLLYV